MLARVLTVLLLGLPAAGMAGQGAGGGADAILRDLGLAAPAEIVRVATSRQPDGSIAVMLQPNGQAKLVADPGVTVVPVDPAGMAVAEPAALVDHGQEYFTLPPVIQVRPGEATALRVEYAYCVVDKQCLFGDVTVPVPPAPG
ncbi:MAG TPA: hypothetical protein VNS22_26905 [Geminicoccus sp.]|uniref:hypothetical protein n=1 Tax=Geminicoccus sp. TaxID=2024832 RepID=UPI002C08F04A|nr:hypothetical protein [Geminicoccus sp.]HWL71990.1 hypothetical protein [Geminicoccus sp.]